MISMLFVLLVTTTPLDPASGGDDLLAGLRTNDVLLADSFLVAARRANQDPKNLSAQLKAARYAYAVLHIADASRHNDLSKSLLRFGRAALALEPGSAEGRLWVGIGIGEVALTNGFLKLPRVRETYALMLENSMTQDADCLSGLAHIHLARTYAQQAEYFGSTLAGKSDALLRKAKQRFPTNPLPTVYQAEQRFREGNPVEGMALRAHLTTVEPATQFEGLMKLATSVDSEDADARLLAWLQ